MKSACDELLRLFKKQGYFRKVDIRTDAYVTWLGAFRGEDGAILILGTGSCGLAVVKGMERYVAGYGPQVSDEASGSMAWTRSDKACALGPRRPHRENGARARNSRSLSMKAPKRS